MSHLHRLPFHIVCGCRLNAVRALHAQTLLHAVHGDRIQVSNMQEECRKDGLAMAQIDIGHRSAAHARAV